jgi:ribosome silencing factor RsfS/YbeB/iojap
MIAKQYPRQPARAALVKTVVAALDDMKAVNVKVMDVRKVTDVADCMVVASGNSDRHVRSIADRVTERAKAAGFRPMGVEGQGEGEWVLVDLSDVIVHILLPRAREFYALEQLWEAVPVATRRASAKKKAKKSLSRAVRPTRKYAGRRAAPGAGKSKPKLKSKAKPRAKPRAQPKAKQAVARKSGRKASVRTRG